MINTEWESHGKRLREALRFGLMTPPYIAAWMVCIIAAMALEIIWKIEGKIERRIRK